MIWILFIINNRMKINYDLVLPVLRIPDLFIAAPGFKHRNLVGFMLLIFLVFCIMFFVVVVVVLVLCRLPRVDCVSELSILDFHFLFVHIFCLSCPGPLQTFKLFGFQVIRYWALPDENYSRNASSAIH